MKDNKRVTSLGAGGGGVTGGISVKSHHHHHHDHESGYQKKESGSGLIEFLNGLGGNAQLVVEVAAAAIVMVFILWILFGYGYVWVPEQTSLEAISGAV